MIYFVRHGQSEANARHVFAGVEDDSPLTDHGREQAKEVGEKLLFEHIQIDHIVCSPLRRCVESAHIIARTIGFNPNAIEIDSRVREFEVGSMADKPTQGVTGEELISAPGAEDTRHFSDRVADAVKEIQASQGNTLIVSHAGVGKMLEINKQHLNPNDFYEIPEPKNAELRTL